MSHSCCSGNFCSQSPGGYQRYLSSSCGSSYPSNLVYSTDLCSPSPCPQGSSLYSGHQETCWEPTSCCTSCYSLRTPTLCSPCWTTYSKSVGCGSSSSCSLSYGSRGCYPLSCGSSGFRPLVSGICGFPTFNHGARFCHSSYCGFPNLQPFCDGPVHGTHCYQLTC